MFLYSDLFSCQYLKNIQQLSIKMRQKVDPIMFSQFSYESYLWMVHFKGNTLRFLTCLEEPICECAIIAQATPEKRFQNGTGLDYFILDLFFTHLIDQAVFYVLTDNRLNPNCLNEPELYKEFQDFFGFYEMEAHGAPGKSCPEIFLRVFDNFPDIRWRDLRLFMTYKKRVIWDLMIKKWFIQKGRPDVAVLCEEEMRRDLTLRERFSEEAENKLKFLFN